MPKLLPKPCSGRLCKNAEGAGFPFQVESLEDGVDDSVHGLHVDEADHGPGSAAHFNEAAFDDVGNRHDNGRCLSVLTRQLGVWYDHPGQGAPGARTSGQAVLTR